MKPLVQAFAKISSAEEMEQLFNELFTENEREALSLRWELMRQLKDGKTQRTIAKDLHISLCKVTRGNKILKDKNSVSNRLLNEENRDE